MYLTQDYYSGLIDGREKYGGIPQNLPHYTGRKFTSDQPFNYKIAEIAENYRNLVFGCYILKSVSSVCSLFCNS
jgi:hypothetical protein